MGCNNVFGCGNNSCLWAILIIIILFSCCGNNGFGGCNNGCGCN